MRGLKRTAAGLAAIALSAGVLAGCGSSSSTSDTGAADTAAVESVASAVENTASTSTTAALTKSEFVAKANAICQKIDNANNSVDDANEQTVAAVKARLQKAVATAKQGVAEMKALTPPADLAAAHATLVETSGQAIVLFEALVTGAENNTLDDATLKADAKKAIALEKAQLSAAKALGLKNCFDDASNTADDNDANDGNDGND